MPLPATHWQPVQAIVKMAPVPICHCEEAKGRRGALSAKREEVPLGCNLGQALAFSPRPSCDPAGYCEIATAPSGPRNDKLGSLMPMNLRCMICKCTRRSLSAATDAIGVYHFNGSQYELGVHCRERHAAPLQGVCGRQSAAAFPSAIRYDYAKRTAGRPSSACQKVPSGFFAKLLPELQNQFLYHDFAILPLRRVMERERTP